jgi:thioredoxin reductase
MNNSELYDAAIIGAGPAGIAAAVQLRRYNIDPLLFESRSIGGLLRNANLVENYVGFPQGIRGEALVELLRKHLESANIETKQERVIEVDFSDGLFKLKTTQDNYSCKIVMLASGTRPKTLSLPASDDEAEDRIFYEVHPLLDIRDKRIAIIGAGDAAFDYALNLARHNQVIINNRGTKISSLPLLQERVIKNDNIEYRADCLIQQVNPTENRLELFWKQNENTFNEHIDFLLIAIGRQPVLDYLSQSLQTHLDDFINKGILHLIGDVKNGIYRQFSIAAGDGVKAAMIAAHKLNEMCQ